MAVFLCIQVTNTQRMHSIYGRKVGTLILLKISVKFRSCQANSFGPTSHQDSQACGTKCFFRKTWLSLFVLVMFAFVCLSIAEM
jgi:fucose permease